MKPYNRTQWNDHVVEKPDTYTIVNNPDGTVQLVEAPGEVIQQGTPMSATNFNNMEEGIFAADAGLSVVVQQLLQHKRILADIEGEIGQITLTNSQSYPFNNSVQTIALLKARDTLNYRVDTEVVSSNGLVGDIEVYDKQLNGFKLRFTGSATSVTIKYIVQGGMYQ